MRHHNLRLLLILLFVSVFSSQAGCAAAELELSKVERLAQPVATAPAEGHLRVMTLNLAHGRRDSFHQLFVSNDHIRESLDAVADLLVREQPHVVATQEADAPSFWSGRFNHLAYLARRSGMASFFNGIHVRSSNLRYGTGLLSRFDLRRTRAHTFRPSPPTTLKGFSVSTIEPSPGVEVDVVSVHLDFSRASVRRRQVDEMIDFLVTRGRPLVVMGDFNTEWEDEETIPRLARALGLHTWRERSEAPKTFPSGRASKRLDWILASKELEFVDHRTLPDVVSDHLGVVADLRLVTPKT